MCCVRRTRSFPIYCTGCGPYAAAGSLGAAKWRGSLESSRPYSCCSGSRCRPSRRRMSSRGSLARVMLDSGRPLFRSCCVRSRSCRWRAELDRPVSPVLLQTDASNSGFGVVYTDAVPAADLRFEVQRPRSAPASAPTAWNVEDALGAAFSPLESNRKTMKSTSGKLPPDEAYCVPRKRSHQAAAAMPGGVARRGCIRARCSLLI